MTFQGGVSPGPPSEAAPASSWPPAVVVVIVFGLGGRTGKIVRLNIHSDLGEIYTLIALPVSSVLHKCCMGKSLVAV